MYLLVSHHSLFFSASFFVTVDPCIFLSKCLIHFLLLWPYNVGLRSVIRNVKFFNVCGVMFSPQKYIAEFNLVASPSVVPLVNAT